MIVLENNIFKKQKEVIQYKNLDPLTTFFTDIQAKTICSKVSNRRIRSFAQLFLGDTSTFDKALLRYQIHFLSNKALQFYGGKILTFIYNLKKWPARTKPGEVLTPYINDIDSYSSSFPELTLTSIEYDQEYTIKFKKAYEKPVDNTPYMTIRNHCSNINFAISRQGLLLNHFENMQSEIPLFMEFINGEITLYSGYDDDVCDICHRTLSDPISIKYGRGPICRRDYGTP